MRRGIANAAVSALLVSSVVVACAKDPPPPPPPPKEHGARVPVGTASIELPIGAALKTDQNTDPESAKSSRLYEAPHNTVLLLQELENRSKDCDAFLDALFAAETKSKDDEGLRPIRSVEILSRHDVNGAKAIYLEAGLRSKMEHKIGRPYHAVVLLTICHPSAALSISVSARTPGPVTPELRSMVDEMASSLTLKK